MQNWDMKVLFPTQKLLTTWYGIAEKYIVENMVFLK